MARRKPDRTDELLAELVKGKDPEEILGEGGVLKQLTLFNESVRGTEYHGKKHTAWPSWTIGIAVVSLASFACGAFMTVMALSPSN